MAVGGADRRADAADCGLLEETPQSGGCQAEAADFVGAPDAERPPATGPRVAVAAEDAPGAHRLSPRAAVVKPAEKAMLNQRADDLAMRAGHQLEPLRQCGPFLGAAVKLHRTHPASPKSAILPARRRGGVVAGYD